MIYYSFIQNSNWSGIHNSGIYGTNFTVNGNICYPSDVVKIQDDDIYNFNTLQITKPKINDWTNDNKTMWLTTYLKFINLWNDNTINNINYQGIGSNPIWFNLILTYADTINIWTYLSGLSLAYINESSSGEISIGVNVYDTRFVMDYASTLPNNNALKTYILLSHKQNECYVSNVGYCDYKGFKKLVWCFDGTKYNYVSTGDLITGCGNVFNEIKLAGNGIKTHYIIKRNVNYLDPTQGLCSGDSGAFCTGDEIMVIDDSELSTYNPTDGWTFIYNPLTQFNYTWYVADVSNPCVDYANYPVMEMKFPIRVIAECEVGNFF
jgi:hypothetical protein